MLLDKGQDKPRSTHRSCAGTLASHPQFKRRRSWWKARPENSPGKQATPVQVQSPVPSPRVVAYELTKYPSAWPSTFLRLVDHHRALLYRLHHLGRHHAHRLLLAEHNHRWRRWRGRSELGQMRSVSGLRSSRDTRRGPIHSHHPGRCDWLAGLRGKHIPRVLLAEELRGPRLRKLGRGGHGRSGYLRRNSHDRRRAPRSRLERRGTSERWEVRIVDNVEHDRGSNGLLHDYRLRRHRGRGHHAHM